MIRRRAHDEGFTLLELLVVLAILGLLAAIVAPQVLRYLGGSRSQTASVQIKNIVGALEFYQLDVGRYPTEAEGLKALVAQPPGLASWNGPYFQRADGLVDPWGRPYIYVIPGKTAPFEVTTLGSDNAAGGAGEAKDIVN